MSFGPFGENSCLIPICSLMQPCRPWKRWRPWRRWNDSFRQRYDGIAWAVYDAQVISQGSVLLQVRRACSFAVQWSWKLPLFEKKVIPWHSIRNCDIVVALRLVLSSTNTVDARNLAPADMVNAPLFTQFYTSQVVQDFFHQHCSMNM